VFLAVGNGLEEIIGALTARAYDSLLASLLFCVCTMAVELVEYLDKREALEVGDRRLELDEDVSARVVAVVCLLSTFGSL